MFLVLFLVFLVFFLSHHFSSRAPCSLLCTLLYLLGSGFGVAEEILQQRKGKTNKYIFCLVVLNFSQKQPLSFHHFRSSLSGPSYASDANWQKKRRESRKKILDSSSFVFVFASFAFVRGKSSVGRQLAQGERKEKRGHRLTHPGLAIFSGRPISSRQQSL